MKVLWGRERVAAHKRRTCSGATADEKRFFAIRKSPDEPLQNIAKIEDFNDSSSNESMEIEATKDEIDAAVAKLFFKFEIDFNVADSAAWKNLISRLNPNYAEVMPSSKTLSGQLLDQQFEETSIKMKEILSEMEGLRKLRDRREQGLN